MKLIYTNTQEEFEAEILEVEEADLVEIEQNKEFEFNWNQEKSNYIFKIVSVADKKLILGLISLMDISEEIRIHVNLLETSKENRGQDKKIDRIAGCLLAFACQIAFEKGYMGFTSLVPKTLLIPLYVKKYGFSQYGRQLAIEGREAINLIEKYL